MDNLEDKILTTSIRKHIPQRIKAMIAEALGITELQKRIDLLYELVYLDLSERSQDAMANLTERSRIRWRESRPDSNLTWGIKLSGENFITKVNSYGGFGPDKAILEIGPGYGRLLRACLKLKMPFKQYVGLDISKKSIAHLRDNYNNENMTFIQGDVEKTSFDTKFDTVLSSLTFKHFFPSFEKALRNLANYVNPGGMFFFDLVEGNKRYFEGDGLTYIHWYTRGEVREILSHLSLQLVAFDEVQHAHNYLRLLVVAKARAWQ